MKKLFLVLALSVALITSTTMAGDQAAKQFDEITALAGEWQGTRFDGKAVTVTYEVVSNGSTVIERLMPDGEANMVTMYHLDGDQLMMTHYCAAQNQPRMRAESGDDKSNTIQFTFIDATSLAKPTDGHMHKLALTFEDGNSLKHVWTWKENGQENPLGFELTRKEMAGK